MSIHHRAMAHLDKGKDLLAKSDPDSLRYAALEIRYAIEHLFYELIPLYKDELPDDVTSGKVWRPGEIIAMIEEIDPGIHHDVTLSFGPESSPGVLAGPMYVMGSQTGIRKDLARRMWNGVGYYLHAPVTGGEHDASKMKAKLEKVAAHLERYRNDRVLAGGLALRSSTKCMKCQRPISKRVQTIKDNPLITCPNSRCGAIYECSEEGERVMFKMLEHNVKCNKCQNDNYLPVHELKKAAQENAFIRCGSCPAVYQAVEYIMFKEPPADVAAAIRARP